MLILVLIVGLLCFLLGRCTNKFTIVESVIPVKHIPLPVVSNIPEATTSTPHDGLERLVRMNLGDIQSSLQQLGS